MSWISVEGFEWIDCNDADHSIVSFIRKKGLWNMLIFVCSLLLSTHYNYCIGVPFDIYYKEIIQRFQDIWGAM